MIKLVVSDIDGTLLLGEKRELSTEIYDIILELKKRNLFFAAASGRQLENMKNLFAPIADDIFYIAENGAICQWEGEPEVLSEFERELAMRILCEVEKFPDCKVAVSTSGTQYIKSGDYAFYEYMTDFVKYRTTMIDSFENIQDPIIKIAFYNEDAQDEHYEYFKTVFKNEIRVAKAGNGWVDFISLDSNKGTGLKFLLEKLGIALDEVIFFGDQQNDIEMLELAGTSYAMAHASRDVQKHAKYITESVEKTLKELLKM